MKKTYQLLLSMAVLLVVGCDLKLKGQIEAFEVLTFNYATKAKKIAKRQKKGLPLTMDVAAGLYNAEIKVEKDKFELKIPSVLGKKQKITFKMPKGKKMPKHGGQIYLTAFETKQPYAVNSNVVLSYENGPTRGGVEYCTKLISYEDCSCSYDGQLSCSSRTAALSGDQDVEYYYQDKIYDVVFDLMSAQAAQAAARFVGQNVKTSKIYTYKSSCQVKPYKIRQLRKKKRQARRQCKAIRDNGNGGGVIRPGHNNGNIKKKAHKKSGKKKRN